MSVAPEPVNPEHDPMTIDPANLGSVDPLSVEGLFLVALGKQGDARAAFLAEQCGDDDRRQRVEALLAAYESAGSFLEKPAIAIEPMPMGQYLAPCEVPGTIGKLGPYEILEEIGRGGMGVVFRAHDPKLQRIVAVKALAPELARLPSARQRFLREARAAAAISHPHVVTIFAVDGTEEASLGTERATLPYLVMECIVGQTLHDKIKRQGALKTEEIVRIARQIAEGLTAAHKRGLIHRDIKPANILLENGVERVKITDFGLARTTSDGGITHTGEILGTPQCMSPEQARGEIVDQRSDLFSLGCVMYTMCTGVSPFRADNMLAVMKKVCESEPRPVAQLNPNVPEWLCALVHQLLQKEPERRVQTAGEVVEVLESRVIATGAQTATSSTRTRHADATSQVAEEGIPKWLLTPILAGWKGWIPDVIISSAACGMIAVSTPEGVLILPTLAIFAVAWLILLFAKWQGRGQWPWVTWPLGIASLVSLYLGMMLTVWVRMESHSRSGVFVFGLAIGIFLLLTRWFPKLFIQTHTPQPVSSASSVPESVNEQPFARAAARPRSPWSVLGWMIVGLMGFVVLGGGLVFFALAIPWYMAVQKTPIETATVVLADDPKIVSVYVDGNPVEHLISEAEGHRWFETTTGQHTIYIGFESNSTEEKFFHNTLTLTHGRNVIDAQPTTRPRNAGTPMPTLHQAGVLPVIVAPTDKPLPGAASMYATKPSGVTIVANAPPSPSIPLADAVEVLTDPQTMPAPAMGVTSGYEEGMTQAVWIDEPGLLIRMKRLGFEGEDGAEIEYYSKVAWGTGPFMSMITGGELPYHFPAGRYRVLVQDLDYGWPLDRRGTITIGNGPLYVHVKRTFQAHQKLSSGTDRFPLAFRWAGKTYQITTPDEVNVVNMLLTTLDPQSKATVFVPESFRTHPLFLEAVHIDPQGWGHSLKRVRTLAQLDVQSQGLQAGFMSSLGRIAWDGPTLSPKFFVPRQELRTFIRDDSFGWDYPPVYDNRPVENSADLSVPIQVRRDREWVRKMIETGPAQSETINVYFSWFGDTADMRRAFAPVVHKLVASWAAGQPDVAEADLLKLAGVTTIEELWRSPAATPAGAFPASDAPVTPATPWAIVVPGKEPGTWRMKEPPEGAVAP